MGEQVKQKDDYRVIKGFNNPRQHQFFIRGDDMSDEIVLLHFEGTESPHITLIHDSGDDTRSINIPVDSIDAFIAALSFLKLDDPELKDNQRKYRKAEG